MNDNYPDLITNLQNMSTLAQAWILVCSPKAAIYVENATVIAKHEGDDNVSGWGPEPSERTLLRMAALHTLLENQSGYDPGQHYCAVVTDWSERAEDMAQFISGALAEPIVPLLITPAVANAAFGGEPLFGASVAESASIVGLSDRGRKGRSR